MRNRYLCLAAALAAVLFSSGALAADDEQAAFDDITQSAKARLIVPNNTPDEIKKAVVAQTEKVYAKCEDYRKRFPAGAHADDIRLLDIDAMNILGSRSEAHRALLDQVPVLAQEALSAKPTPERALRARVALVSCNAARQSLAATPEAGKPFEAEALKQAETILGDFPQNPVVPMVLDYLGTAYWAAGREKDSIAAFERIVKDFPGTPAALNADRALKLRALKGTAIDLSYKSATGDVVDLKDYRGKVVFVDFWASWCGPCRDAMPALIEVEKKFRDQGFRVIGVSFDQDQAAMDAYVKEMGMTWPQRFDGMGWQSPVAAKYFISAIPMTLLIDKSGKVREIGVAGPKLADAVKKLLDEPAPQ